MKVVTVTDAKNRLSAVLDQVRAGETVVITDRGVPVARLEPMASAPDDAEGRIARLERLGLLRRAATVIRERDALEGRRPKLRRGASAVRAVLDERAAGW
jgi:prevent-host-death family protein